MSSPCTAAQLALPSFFHPAITWLNITIYINECCTSLILSVCTWVFTFCYFLKLYQSLHFSVISGEIKGKNQMENFKSTIVNITIQFFSFIFLNTLTLLDFHSFYSRYFNILILLFKPLFFFKKKSYFRFSTFFWAFTRNLYVLVLSGLPCLAGWQTWQPFLSASDRNS